VSAGVDAPVSIERRDDVTVLHLTAGENRFNPSSLDAIEAGLAEVEFADGPGALVITGEGKFFSNGLDLDWLGSAPPGGAEELVARVHALMARVLVFPTATVAAINGHCFAAGAMLAAACDARVMRVDRGFWCLPEVDIGLPFTPGMTALLKARLPVAAAHEAMTTGRRYGGDAALAAGIVDGAVAEERVLDAAVEHAAALAGKQRVTLAAIKRNLYADAVAALSEVARPADTT
jgi:enoyl-CoA hydratase/carnithine racemase